GILVRIGWRLLMDGAPHFVRNLSGLVDWLADHVDDATERAFADRHRDRLAGVGHLLTADQTFGCIHSYRAHGVFAELLRDFQHQTAALVIGLKRIEDRR